MKSRLRLLCMALPGLLALPLPATGEDAADLILEHGAFARGEAR